MTVNLPYRTLDVYGQMPYTVRMAKDERFESRLSADGRAALEKLATFWRVSRASVIEMVLADTERRVFTEVKIENGKAMLGERPVYIEPDAAAEQQAKDDRAGRKVARKERKGKLQQTVSGALPARCDFINANGQRCIRKPNHELSLHDFEVLPNKAAIQAALEASPCPHPAKSRINNGKCTACAGRWKE